VEFHLGHGDMIRLLRRWHALTASRISRLTTKITASGTLAS